MAIKSSGKGMAAKKVSKRPRPESPSDTSSASSSVDGEDDRAAMLAALEAHGRAMFGFDGPEEAESSEQGRKRLSGTSESGEESADLQEEDDDDAEAFSSDDGWGEGDEMVTDSEDEMMIAPKPVVKTAAPVSRVPEVVFAETTTSNADLVSKSDRRAFLKGTSAKMMGIKPELDYGPKSKKRQREEAEEDLEDQSNLSLDKTLHDMLLTNLLPGADAAAAHRPVDKRKAMSGRLLELAQYQLPGEGSKTVSTSHLSSHPAKIRTGMIHAQAKRDAKARAEAEAAGSFVRGLGGLGGEGKGYKAEKGRGQRAGLGEDTGKKKGMDGRKDEKRDRGLSMGGGMGRFAGGMLKLTEREVERGSQMAERGRGRGRGRGGRGGRGGGRGGGGRGRGGGRGH